MKSLSGVNVGSTPNALFSGHHYTVKKLLRSYPLCSYRVCPIRSGSIRRLTVQRFSCMKYIVHAIELSFRYLIKSSTCLLANHSNFLKTFQRLAHATSKRQSSTPNVLNYLSFITCDHAENLLAWHKTDHTRSLQNTLPSL